MESKSCSRNTKNDILSDIENLFKHKEEKFKSLKITKEVFDDNNFQKYKEIILKLIDFKSKNYNKYKKSKFKSLFRKELDKLSKRNDINVSKMHLVTCYNSIVKNKEIENDSSFKHLISKVPTRTLSGIIAFAILLSPKPNGQTFSCKHDCYYCPDQSIENGSPIDIARSYLKEEPAVERGFQNFWDAVLQIFDRLISLDQQGHSIDKIEIIVEGGTFTEFPKDYLVDFFRDIYYACNVFSKILKESSFKLREKMTLQEEMYYNSYDSDIKLIGICIETRPDAIDDDWITFFRYLGVTRIQIGIQHSDNKLLKYINRGHTFEDSCKGVRILKDNCFKIGGHLMPDLPFSSPKKDIKMFNEVFNTTKICLDDVKIYPCQVVNYTVIKKWYNDGKYIPYSETNFKEFIKVIKYALLNVPRYTRVSRIIRDFDFNKHVVGGNPHSNLKQLAINQLEKDNKFCQDIRTREIGRHPDYNYDYSCFINVNKYTDEDYFIEMVSRDEKVLFGFIRLRIPENYNNTVFKNLKNKGFIRELHVYNTLVPVGESNNITTQHKGIGRLLLQKAEYISWTKGCEGVAVIHGIGVARYYEKNGYSLKEGFMVKTFKTDYLKVVVILQILIFNLIYKIIYWILSLKN